MSTRLPTALLACCLCLTMLTACKSEKEEDEEKASGQKRGAPGNQMVTLTQQQIAAAGIHWEKPRRSQPTSSLVLTGSVTYDENRVTHIAPSVSGRVASILVDYGVRVAGCTVHLVDEGLDSGPIVAQRAVAVEDEDTVEALSARILVEEHRVYPFALRRLLSERWRIEGRRVVFEPV